MKFMLIDAKYKGKIEISKKALSILKNYKTIAVYTTTQFNHKLKPLLEQLKKINIKIISSQPERTDLQFQILGCDIYYGNLNLNPKEEVDAYLYIGDGKFHPRALLFQENDSEKNKPVITYNPISNKLNIFDEKDIQKVINKEKANIKRFLMSKKVGVLITTKPGQEHFHYFKKLEEKYKNKEFYAFIADSINFSEMENFPFIQTWINTACPRIGKEDTLELEQALINAETALRLR